MAEIGLEDVDAEVLEQAAAALGTVTPRDTVNAALREVVRARLVEEYVAYLRGLSEQVVEADREEAWR